MSKDLIALTALPGLLAKQGIVVSYSAVWRRAVDCAIPFTRQGRLMFAQAEDLPKIAAYFRSQAQAYTNRGVSLTDETPDRKRLYRPAVKAGSAHPAK